MYGREHITLLTIDQGANAEDTKGIVHFFHIFSENVLTDIVRYKNLYIESFKNRYTREKDSRKTDIVMQKAFIDLLYFAVTKQMNHLYL